MSIVFFGAGIVVVLTHELLGLTGFAIFVPLDPEVDPVDALYGHPCLVSDGLVLARIREAGSMLRRLLLLLSGLAGMPVSRRGRLGLRRDRNVVELEATLLHRLA